MEKPFDKLAGYDSNERAETFNYLKRALNETRASLGAEAAYKERILQRKIRQRSIVRENEIKSLSFVRTDQTNFWVCLVSIIGEEPAVQVRSRLPTLTFISLGTHNAGH